MTARLLVLVAAVCASLPAQNVPLWGVFEDAQEAAKNYAHPLHDLTVEATFTSPSGARTTVPAFWDGARNWRVRFSPDEPGRWRFAWTASDGSSGLGDRSGAFVAVPSEQAENRFARHGAVSVAPEGRHFAHADGTPFFWLGDTAWNGVLLAREHDWERYLAHRARQNYSVIQFVAFPWRSASGNENGRPAFYGREQVTVDPDYFQRMDQRVEAINRHGLLAAVVMFWTHSRHVDLNPGMFLPESELTALGRYLIARYGAYQTTWILGGDGDYRDERAARWRRVGRSLFADDSPGHDRPVTVHATYWCADAFQGEDWWDYNGYQSGHLRVRGLERVTQGEPTEFWKSDQRPSLNLEPNYEAHRNRTRGADPDDYFDALDVRRQAWHSLLNGPPAGVTYGVHGIWAWHPRAEEPMTHPGTGIGPVWHEAMQLEGGDDMRVLADLFEQLDWTALRPAQGLLRTQPGAADVLRWVSVAQGGGMIVAYSGSGDAIEVNADAQAAAWYSPRTGEWIDAEPSASYQPPSRRDWVLILETGD